MILAPRCVTSCRFLLGHVRVSFIHMKTDYWSVWKWTCLPYCCKYCALYSVYQLILKKTKKKTELMMLFDLWWGKDEGWTSLLRSRDVNPCFSVAGICKQTKGYTYFWGWNLIPCSRGTENHPQREPEPFALPAHYLHFPFFSAKTKPPDPSRSAPHTALRAPVRPSVHPRPRCPSGAVHPSALGPSGPHPAKGGAGAGDENGSLSFSGYKETKKNI